MSKLKILQSNRISMLCYWNNVINGRTHWIRISDRLIDRLATDSTDRLCCKYYLFICLILGSNCWIPLRSVGVGRSIWKSTPLGHFFNLPWVIYWRPGVLRIQKLMTGVGQCHAKVASSSTFFPDLIVRYPSESTKILCVHSPILMLIVSASWLTVSLIASSNRAMIPGQPSKRLRTHSCARWIFLSLFLAVLPS